MKLKKLINNVVSRMVFTRDVGVHVTRYYMYAKLKSLENKAFSGARVLNVSGSDKLIKIVGLADESITKANFPGCDLLNLLFDDNTFDFVVADQILEHVGGDPFVATNEIKRVLKPNGVAVVTTCFVNPIHNHPVDMWRFTPDGLRCLFGGFSKVVSAEGWGNRYVWILDALGLRFKPVPNKKWHPLHWIATYNESNWPIVTWIVAIK